MEEKINKEDIRMLKSIVQISYGQEPISLNDIMKELNIGFNRTLIYLKILEFLNIVESKPRKLVVSVSDAFKIIDHLGGKDMNIFDNIIGYEHIKIELERLVDCINNKEKYEKLGVKIPKNLLLYGEAGLGKTSFANAFVNALNRKKYIIRKNKPDGEFVNEVSRIITEAMNNTPSVVMLDDVDKYSNNDGDHKNADEYIVIQTCIDDCKDKDVFFIATANSLDDMPDSLLRAGRFSNKIEFEPPTIKDATIIIKHYLSDKCIELDVDCEEIARLLEGKSCAILESIMNEAGLYAGYNNQTTITNKDIIKACLRIIYNAPENLDNKTVFQIEAASYHEAGHALMSEYLEPNSVNLVSVANYFGNKGGLTSQTMDKDYWCDFTKMENRVMVLLAGKAATEVIFNKVDVGCESDIERARKIVERFYQDYGLNNFKYACFESSQSSKETKENWISQKLVDYYSRVKTILHTNMLPLTELAHKLQSEETLNKKQLKEVFDRLGIVK